MGYRIVGEVLDCTSKIQGYFVIPDGAEITIMTRELSIPNFMKFIDIRKVGILIANRQIVNARIENGVARITDADPKLLPKFINNVPVDGSSMIIVGVDKNSHNRYYVVVPNGSIISINVYTLIDYISKNSIKLLNGKITGCNIVPKAGKFNTIVMRNDTGLNINGSMLIGVQNRNVNMVNIPKGIKIINDNAFQNLQELKSVKIPDTVEKIGKGAFRGCNSLKEIVVPDSVQVIDIEAFQHCTNLSRVILSRHLTGISDGMFESSGVTRMKLPDSVEWVGRSSFIGCTKLVEIDLPQNLKLIRELAFSACTSLEYIDIPDSVQRIGRYSFSDCRNLKRLTMPRGLQKLEDATFSFCDSLESIALPDGVTSIGNDCFWNCTNLREIKLSRSLKVIGDGAFKGCRALREVVLPDGIERIENDAFSDCKSLCKVVINSVVDIDDRAFSGSPYITICSSNRDVLRNAKRQGLKTFRLR